nr:MAG TPA: hypothetical protein [Caudoviricetes sp.]
MVQFVTADDLKVINKALNEEKDVRIQRTRDGYRIVEDTVRVLLKKSTAEK